MVAAIRRRKRSTAVTACLVTLVALYVGVRASRPARATSGGDPYTVPLAVDTNPAPDVVRDDDHRPVKHGGHRARAAGQRPDVQRLDTRSGIPCEGRRHRHRPLQEQHRASDGHPLARHRTGQRERRHAADAEHRAAGRHVLVQVQGHASGRLLVSPASPFVDEPGVQGHVRHLHRHEHRTRRRCRRPARSHRNR